MESFSTNTGSSLVSAPGLEVSAVPISTVASAGCVIAASQFLSAQANGHTSLISSQGGHSPRLNHIGSIRERSENEEEEERIEAELDEMARYIGPVAKSLFTPVVAPLVDANSFADALGVSPLYKQKESQRWSSALNIYRQMSSNDQNASGGQQHHTPPVVSSQVSEDEPNLFRSASMGNCIVVGDFDENMLTSATPPTSRPTSIPLAARQQNQQPTPQNTPSASSARHMLSPPMVGSPFTGFMTPPAMAPWALPHSGASYVVSPPRRKSSSISPNEASLNSLELEAIAAVHELQFAVKDIYVSEMLPRTSELIFLNLTTLEGQAYCVELTMKGWRVTSHRHDCMNGDINNLDLHVQYFETIYALMDRISPAYRRRFTDALMSKLAAVQAERNDETEMTSAMEKVAEESAQVENNSQDRLEQEQRQTFT